MKGDSIGTATSLNIGGSGGDGMESRNVTVTNGNVLTTRETVLMVSWHSRLAAAVAKGAD